MNKNNETPIPYGFIFSAIVLTFLGVWVVASSMQSIFQKKSHKKHAVQKSDVPTSRVDLKENVSSVQAVSQVINEGASVLAKPRTLKTYYKNRAYHGAPPKIPHPVKETNGKVQKCLTCHKDGGFSPKYKAYAPVTPHPHFTNCVQCHVPTNQPTLFKGTDWTSVKPPKLGFSALPGGPPPVPHSLQMRQNCASCHSGPGAVKEIKSPHPYRLNCLQCHVPRLKVKHFESKLKP